MKVNLSRLLYRSLRSENFLYRRVSLFPLYGLSIRLRLVVANPCLAHL